MSYCVAVIVVQVSVFVCVCPAPLPEPLWLFSQSDACQALTIMGSKSAVSSAHLAHSRKGRVSWPVISALEVTGMDLRGHATSPLVQVYGHSWCKLMFMIGRTSIYCSSLAWC